MSEPAGAVAQRASAPFVRVAVAASLSVLNSAGARLLPTWRSLRGLAHGMDGWRAARAAADAGEATMERLVDRLGWTRDALPTPDGYAGSPDLLSTLADYVLTHRPSVAVEFGSGLSTLVIARALQMNGGGSLVSYDHNPGFAGLTRRRLAALGLDADVRVADLVPAEPYGYPGAWYDAKRVPDAIDLLLIDGPPDWLQGGVGARGAAAPTLFSRLSPGGVVLLDDADRDGERAVADRWRCEFPWVRFDMLPAQKGLLRGIRFA